MEIKGELEILLVDDDVETLKGLCKLLELEGYRVITASNGYEALKCLETNTIDIVITDIKMPGLSGFDLLDETKRIDFNIPVMLLTAYISIEDAVEAMKRGAEDYLSKPVKIDELMFKLKKVCEGVKLKRQNRELRRRLREKYRFSQLVGNTPAMQRIFKTIEAVAASSASILIYGETGTGKELVANAIHYNSPRADGPFVVLHCAALTESLLESELFGHEKGAFTGAIKAKKGRFELAHGGSLFLDEVAEMSPSVQVKLLRILEQGEFERVGGEKTIKVDIRLIAATNKNLEEEVKKGRFREDLYYRLNVIAITIPPLRERKEDVPLLTYHFLQKYQEKDHEKVKDLTPKTLELLQEYHWPGNVRELENAIERALVLSKGDMIQPDWLPSYINVQPQKERYFPIPVGIPLKEAEKIIILKTLETTGGKKSEAAKLLKISTRKIEYKVKGWVENP